jgi:hypothetical protein
MSDKLKQLLKDLIFYGKGGHLVRAVELAKEIEIQVGREERETQPVASEAKERTFTPPRRKRRGGDCTEAQ